MDWEGLKEVESNKRSYKHSYAPARGATVSEGRPNDLNNTRAGLQLVQNQTISTCLEQPQPPKRFARSERWRHSGGMSKAKARFIFINQPDDTFSSNGSILRSRPAEYNAKQFARSLSLRYWLIWAHFKVDAQQKRPRCQRGQSYRRLNNLDLQAASQRSLLFIPGIGVFAIKQQLIPAK